MSEFNVTVLMLQHKINVKRNDRDLVASISDCTTNEKGLEIIRIFSEGNCRVSSVSEVPKLDKSAFKVVFNSTDNSEVQDIIEKFNQVFAFKAISEVSKN